MDAQGRKKPEPIFQSESIRRAILASYWIVVLLTVPLWWSTTSIERLSLPTSLVQAQAAKELRFPVDVLIKATNTDSVSLTSYLQRQLERRTLDKTVGWEGLDVRLQAMPSHNLANESGMYVVEIENGKYGEEEALIVRGRTLHVRSAETSLSGLPSRIDSVLTALLAPYSILADRSSHEHRVAKYASRYRLAFTLLNEDTTAGEAATGWDIQGSIARYISPFLHCLHALHNFTAESQVQFHAPLAFSPQLISVDGVETYGLTQEDLTVFVNSEDWTLSSSVSNDPVLHFVLFVPSAARRPLRILDGNGAPSGSDAFIVPQWGGIVILNLLPSTPEHVHLSSTDLGPTFSTFSSQLLALLGVPTLPSGVFSSTPLSDWQMDALLRRRAMENTAGSKQTLSSIVNLVAQIENMPVGQDVRGAVQESLIALEKVYGAATQSPQLALQYSGRALALASDAFFNPGMLAMLYFPAEHKAAVYAPLFAPFTIPLILAAIREFRDWRKKRAAAREATAARKE